MDDPSRTRRRAAITLSALIGGVVVLVLTFATMGVFSPPGRTPTSTDWEIGSGLVTMGALQQVSPTAYWTTFCPSAQGACMAPAGVTYVPSAQRVFVTELKDPQEFQGGMNAFVELDPETFALTAPVPLPCYPMIPFYPGVGSDVLIPCWNENGTVYVLFVDGVTAQVVSTIVVPLPWGAGFSMTYDAADGLVYWGENSGTIVVLDLESPSIEQIVNLTEARIAPTFIGNAYQLLWDPATDQLVMPSVAGGLIAVNPATWAVEANISLPAPATTLALDLATNQLFVSTANTVTAKSSVSVFNAATFAFETTFSIPNCFYNICAVPNEVNQILFDPVYGDAYFVSTMAFISVNLTTMSLVSALFDAGDVWETSSVLVPGLDLVFGTYAPLILGPGFVVSLAHGSQPFLSQLLWLPTSVAQLLLAGAVGIVLAVLRPGYVPPEKLEEFDPPLSSLYAHDEGGLRRD